MLMFLNLDSQYVFVAAEYVAAIHPSEVAGATVIRLAGGGGVEVIADPRNVAAAVVKKLEG